VLPQSLHLAAWRVIRHGIFLNSVPRPGGIEFVSALLTPAEYIGPLSIRLHQNGTADLTIADPLVDVRSCTRVQWGLC
jgi:hypothetical protein